MHTIVTKLKKIIVIEMYCIKVQNTLGTGYRQEIDISSRKAFWFMAKTYKDFWILFNLI